MASLTALQNIQVFLFCLKHGRHTPALWGLGHSLPSSLNILPLLSEWLHPFPFSGPLSKGLGNITRSRLALVVKRIHRKRALLSVYLVERHFGQRPRWICFWGQTWNHPMLLSFSLDKGNNGCYSLVVESPRSSWVKVLVPVWCYWEVVETLGGRA